MANAGGAGVTGGTSDVAGTGDAGGTLMWRVLDETCRRGVSEGVSPGAVVLVGRGREVLFHRSYGSRALVPERLPMTPDTVFDLSSLTKPVATATAMMLLVRDGRVRRDDPVSTAVPEFIAGAKSWVTFRQLLNHTSGLPAWKPYYESVIPRGTERQGPPPSFRRKPESRGEAGVVATPPRKMADARAEAAAFRRHCLDRLHGEELLAQPGEKHLYSDLGFILLGEAVERLSGKPLDRFCRDEIFAPMGLTSTFFVDLSATAPEPRPGAGRAVAATEDCPRRGKILCGEVHDDNAYAIGGVAGHAGLFSSAPDIHRFLCFLARCREDAEPDYLPGAVVREFLEAERTLPGQTHVLGWDTPSPQGSSSGRHFSSRTVGHLGFTGTSVWWDLERAVHVVLLTNRVHPSRDNDAIRQFRPLVHDAAMEALGS